MATPFVTGALGAAFALHGGLTAPQAINLLYASAKSNGSLAGKVDDNREIDLYAFLQAVKTCRDNPASCSNYQAYPDRPAVQQSSGGRGEGGGGGGCSINPDAKFNITGLVLAIGLFMVYRKCNRIKKA
jgi:hypothetical protein